jgi:hypothetical protein
MLIHRRAPATARSRSFLERPFREARLRAYITRNHRAGRALSEILNDPYVARCGSDSLCRRVLVDARTIAALERSTRAEFERLRRSY